jgi:dipeptidyl aminopeptidase/acylaminoacyl peptidase
MNPGFDQRIADWLEDDPDDAPDIVLTTVLAAFPSIPQRRATRVPWRFQTMSLSARLVAAAIALAVVAVGGAIVLRPGGPSNVAATPSALSPASQTLPSVGPSTSPIGSRGAVDYSALPGRILMEHAGNAPDGSEQSPDYHIDRRRFFWMDPKTMTGSTAVEFLPRQPAPGKVAGDISPDQTKIVFQDAGDGSGEYIWTANLDGTGLTKIVTACNTARAACGDWDPSFDPTGTKVVFVRAQADTTILEIKDLRTGKETRLLSTEGSSTNDVAERPDWSPDGTKIAFGRIHWRSENNPESGAIYIVDVATDRTTKLSIAGVTFPGNPHWSPDGSRILFLDGPLSMAPVPLGDPTRTADIYTVAPDGSDLQRLTHTNGVIAADYTPDGRHVFFFNNYFWMMNPDGTDARPVNDRGDDLSDLNVGFGYVGHWINNPPSP